MTHTPYPSALPQEGDDSIRSAFDREVARQRAQRAQARIVAEDRAPTDSCECGTPGCSIDHESEWVLLGVREGECATW